MSIRHLKIFIEVYKMQSITKAAKHLQMSQPAVTRVVQELEKYYGVILFERINRRLVVTECGKKLYAHAVHIIDTLDAMEKGLRDWDELGVLRIGASITLGNFMLPEIVKKLQAQYPNLKIRVMISNGAKLQQALLEGQLDVAIIEGRIYEEQLCFEEFADDRLVLIMPPEHPLYKADKIFLKDLQECDFLLREQGSAGRSFLDHVFAFHGFTIEPAWESTSTDALVKAVHYGLGISFLPEQLVRSDIQSGFVVTRKIEDESFKRKHCIAWHQNKFLTTSAQDFMNLCRNYNMENI